MFLPDLVDRYNCDEKCRSYMEELRWPKGPSCPKCESKNITRIGNRESVLRCKNCEHQFTVTVSTIFHDSHLPLTKWFLAILLMCEAKKGMSAWQLKRTLGMAYKTAWYLCHRIRQAMANANLEGPKLTDIVEMDETYIGGKAPGQGVGRGSANKTVVVGVVERKGRLRLVVVPDASAESLQKTAKQYVSRDVEMIVSDELSSYVPALAPLYGEKHRQIAHSKSYVEGIVHTNSIESAFSLLKRGIIGSWHKVSVKHLQRYLEEMSYRFSQRDNPMLFSLTLKNLLTTDPLTFKSLTNSPAA